MSFSQRERDYTECQIPSLLLSLVLTGLSSVLHVPLTTLLAMLRCSLPTEQFNDSQHLVNAWLYRSCLRSEAVTLENTISSINSSSLGSYSETTCLRAAQEIIPALLRLAFGNLVSRMFEGKGCISRPSQSD